MIKNLFNNKPVAWNNLHKELSNQETPLLARCALLTELIVNLNQYNTLLKYSKNPTPLHQLSFKKLQSLIKEQLKNNKKNNKAIEHCKNSLIKELSNKQTIYIFDTSIYQNLTQEFTNLYLNQIKSKVLINATTFEQLKDSENLPNKFILLRIKSSKVKNVQYFLVNLDNSELDNVLNLASVNDYKVLIPSSLLISSVLTKQYQAQYNDSEVLAYIIDKTNHKSFSKLNNLFIAKAIKELTPLRLIEAEETFAHDLIGFDRHFSFNLIKNYFASYLFN